MAAEWTTIFERVNWQDGEDGGTPLSAQNLNRGDAAIATIDTRVVTLNNNLNECVQEIRDIEEALEDLPGGSGIDSSYNDLTDTPMYLNITPGGHFSISDGTLIEATSEEKQNLMPSLIDMGADASSWYHAPFTSVDSISRWVCEWEGDDDTQVYDTETDDPASILPHDENGLIIHGNVSDPSKLLCALVYDSSADLFTLYGLVVKNSAFTINALDIYVDDVKTPQLNPDYAPLFEHPIRDFGEYLAQDLSFTDALITMQDGIYIVNPINNAGTVSFVGVADTTDAGLAYWNDEHISSTNNLIIVSSDGVAKARNGLKNRTVRWISPDGIRTYKYMARDTASPGYFFMRAFVVPEMNIYLHTIPVTYWEPIGDEWECSLECSYINQDDWESNAGHYLATCQFDFTSPDTSSESVFYDSGIRVSSVTLGCVVTLKAKTKPTESLPVAISIMAFNDRNAFYPSTK